MNTVGKLLDEKGRNVWSVGPDASVYEALRIMAEKNIGALLVIEGVDLVGIFSERDYARNSIQDERSNFVIPVSDLMTRKVITAAPDKSLQECMALMTSNRIRHLPILDRGHAIGLVTVGDVGKKIISEQRHTIDEIGKGQKNSRS